MKTKKRELITVALVIGLIAVTAMAYMIYTNKIIGNKNIVNNGNSSENPQALAEGETWWVSDEWTPETLKETVDTSKWDLDKLNIVESADGIPVPVPKGFFASELEGENTVLGGFVIYSGEESIKGVLDEEGNKTDVLGTYSADPDSYWQQSCNRNQYVWVPVPDVETIYIEKPSGKKYFKNYGAESVNGEYKIKELAMGYLLEPGILTIPGYDDEYTLRGKGIEQESRQEFLEYLETEFEATISSIEKYGGYYIGRYETGRLGDKAVVRRMNTNIKSWSWYEAYNKLQYLEDNKYIKSSLIWNGLWDETLLWLIDSGNKTQKQITDDMNSWCNYSNSVFTYTSLSGSQTNKTLANRICIPTGSAEKCKGNNIYDLAGNLAEWSLGRINGWRNRILCGGTYDSTRSGSGTINRQSPMSRTPQLPEKTNCDAYGNTEGTIHQGGLPVNPNGARAFFYIK